jgi:hypothetical protein
MRVIRKCRTGESQAGIALILVMLVMLVLSAIAIMTMYSSGVDYTMDVAFRNRSLARTASEAGANVIVSKLMFSINPYATPDKIPSGGAGGDFNLGTTRVHKAIGLCVVIDSDCANHGLINEDSMCCFRLGPYMDPDTSNLYRPKVSGDLTALSAIPQPVLLNIPGTSDFQNLLYNFSVTGGGPGGSVSVLAVGYKKGPVAKRGGSGTMYGSVTGANFN